MTHRHFRWITASCAALFGLSACGSTTTISSPTTRPATLVPAQGSPQVIRIAGQGTKVAGEASMAADSPAVSEMYPFWNVTYQYEGTPPDLTAPAGSWYFAPGNEPTADRIAEVAAVLGVTGDLKRLPVDQGGGWIVGPEDYSDATLSVSADAMYSWYYSPSPTTIGSSGTISSSTGCAVAVPGGAAIDPDGTTDPSAEAPVETTVETLVETVDTTVDLPADMPVCEVALPPVGVPTGDEAKAKATAFFASMGLDLSSYELETYADDWNANVTAYLVLDGSRTSVAQTVGYGAEGALFWASGFFGTPQRGDDYDRIGVPAAIERLNTQGGPWMGSGGGLRAEAAGSAIDPAQPLPAPVETIPPAPGSESTDAVSDGPDTAVSDGPDTAVSDGPDTAVSDGPIDTASIGTDIKTKVVDPIATDPLIGVAPVPCDPTTECATVDAPMVITLTNARPTLEQLWAVDNTVWLLPGYAFDSADSGTYSVIAVPDEFIQVNDAVNDGVPPEQSILETVETGDPAPPPASALPTESVPAGG